MTADHDELHEWAGAYALGALAPDDRRRFERHLAVCDRCAHDVRVLAPIPGLLGRIEPEDVGAGVSDQTADEIAGRVRRDEQRLHTSRRRWRAAALASAAVAVIVVSALVLDVGSSGERDDSAVAATVTSSLAVSSEVSTSARGWGTQIELRLAGLPRRAEYQLWVVGDDGEWSVAATWGPTESGGANIIGATSMPTSNVDRVVVTSEDRADVIIDAAT